ncbi:MAG: glycosyltransferase [Defluviitaleaceae bacterium]|nr:glycosyltransferase [Defluviitaleaceae bacterium]
MSYKQQNFVSAVIYVHDDENTVEASIKTVHAVLAENFEKFEIICVNDASTDNTKQIIKGIGAGMENCMVSILNMSYYQGLEASMRAGVDLAIGDFVFEFDKAVVDFEPGLIMQLYNRALQGYDIVSCGSGAGRVSSRLFYSIYNRFSATQHMLQSETFRVISRRGINRVNSLSVTAPYRKAIYANCGLKIDYIKYKPTHAGSGKQMLKNPQDTALNTLIIFSDIAYKITMFFTVLMMLLTLAVVGYVIAIYVMGNPIEGYTTMMILISVSFFGVFGILTMIIKYLSLMLGLIFNRQKYVIESIEKITG